MSEVVPASGGYSSISYIEMALPPLSFSKSIDIFGMTLWIERVVSMTIAGSRTISRDGVGGGSVHLSRR